MTVIIYSMLNKANHRFKQINPKNRRRNNLIYKCLYTFTFSVTLAHNHYVVLIWWEIHHPRQTKCCIILKKI